PDRCTAAPLMSSFSSALAASTSLARVVAPFPTGARRCGPTCGPRPRARARRLLLLRFSVWVNQISRFGICGPDYWLHFAIAELIEIVRLHVLELRPDLARFRPFAVAREAEAAAYGVELRLVHVCRELVVIQALRFRHSLHQHLSGRRGERTPGKAERIDSGRARLHAVPLQEIDSTRNAWRLRRSEVLPDQQAVGERTELHFERGHQHADHRAPEHFRRQPDL